MVSTQLRRSVGLVLTSIRVQRFFCPTIHKATSDVEFVASEAIDIEQHGT
jgi:hypothetical protein